MNPSLFVKTIAVINSCKTEQQLMTAHKYVRRVATVDFETALECGLYLIEKMQALRNPQEK
jgi:ActR/RegA family two-component response regulator